MAATMIAERREEARKALPALRHSKDKDLVVVRPSMARTNIGTIVLPISSELRDSPVYLEQIKRAAVEVLRARIIDRYGKDVLPDAATPSPDYWDLLPHKEGPDAYVLAPREAELRIRDWY